MNHPQVGVGVFVIRDTKILFHKRKNAHGDGTWSLPGGHLEFGESWEQCAIREVFEETGLRIKKVRFAAATNDIFSEEQKHYVTLFMVAEHEEGEALLKEPDKAECWEWFSWENLPSPLFIPLENLRKQGFHPRRFYET